MRIRSMRQAVGLPVALLILAAETTGRAEQPPLPPLPATSPPIRMEHIDAPAPLAPAPAPATAPWAATTEPSIPVQATPQQTGHAWFGHRERLARLKNPFEFGATHTPAWSTPQSHSSRPGKTLHNPFAFGASAAPAPQPTPQYVPAPPPVLTSSQSPVGYGVGSSPQMGAPGGAPQAGAADYGTSGTPGYGVPGASEAGVPPVATPPAPGATPPGPVADGATPPGTAAAAFAAADAAGPGFGGGVGSSGDVFAMVGDQSPFRFRSPGQTLFANPTGRPGLPGSGNGNGGVGGDGDQPGPPPLPGPRAGALFFPALRNFKITENMSPRPQDRVWYSFNYYDDVNAAINRRFESPIANIKAYRHIFGLEKTFFDGYTSLGVRIPLNTVTADSTLPNLPTPTSTALGNLTVFGKAILAQDPKTGSLVSVGLALTPPTGPERFADAPYLFGLNTMYIQPFLGYIWNRGRFYVQGFSAFDFPVNPADVSIMYNDIGMGYFLYRSDQTNRFLTAIAPTFETHVNTPLNHRDVFNAADIAGTADVVNLTYGLNLEFFRSSVLTFAMVQPVTGPRPFDIEWALLFNVYYGRTRANRLATIPPPLL